MSEKVGGLYRVLRGSASISSRCGWSHGAHVSPTATSLQHETRRRVQRRPRPQSGPENGPGSICLVDI